MPRSSAWPTAGAQSRADLSCLRGCCSRTRSSFVGFTHQVLAGSRQKPRQEAGDSFEQNPLFGTKGGLAITLDAKIAEIAPGDFHRNQNLPHRPRSRHVRGVVPSFEQWRGSFLAQGEVNPNPTVVAAFAQDLGYSFQRRMMEGRAVGGEHILNVRKQSSTRTI